MQIDTHSKTTMEQSLCNFLNIKQTAFSQLYNDIYNSVEKEPWLFISDYIDENWNSEVFDKVQFYHLTRRLDGTDIRECTNLRELLITENPFSSFLKAHRIYFEINDKGTLDLFFQKRKLVLNSIESVCNSNLIGRLKKDYCVNGFAVRNLLEKENCGYYNSLIGCPEVISVLDDSLKLNNGLIYDYIKHSKPYCVEYNVPIDEIIIDGYKLEISRNVKTDILLNGFIRHLYAQWCNFPNIDCIILRLQDNARIDRNYFVSAEEL